VPSDTWSKEDLPRPIKLSVIFPAYNEEQNIGRAVDSALQVLEKIADNYEVIVVNDGSRDSTEKIVQQIYGHNGFVRLISHERNVGYGGSLRSGLEAASYDLIFFTDADLQFDLKEILNLLRWIQEYDLVIGYRLKRSDAFRRRFCAWGWGLLIRLLFDLKVKDIDCAFKLFRKEVFNKISISSLGAFINSEILIRAEKCGFTVKEVPVSHYPRLAGKGSGARLKTIYKAFHELFKLYRELK
jgi:glycosyltransferase involved in cell wall biosynthesis